MLVILFFVLKLLGEVAWTCHNTTAYELHRHFIGSRTQFSVLILLHYWCPVGSLELGCICRAGCLDNAN